MVSRGNYYTHVLCLCLINELVENNTSSVDYNDQIKTLFIAKKTMFILTNLNEIKNKTYSSTNSFILSLKAFNIPNVNYIFMH